MWELNIKNATESIRWLDAKFYSSFGQKKCLSKNWLKVKNNFVWNRNWVVALSFDLGAKLIELMRALFIFWEVAPEISIQNLHRRADGGTVSAKDFAWKIVAPSVFPIAARNCWHSVQIVYLFNFCYGIAAEIIWNCPLLGHLHDHPLSPLYLNWLR